MPRVTSGSHSLFLIRASCFELSTATLPAQLTQTRHPRGTQEIPLSAALFPTLHGSQVPVAQDPGINATYAGQLTIEQPEAGYHLY